MIIFAGPFCGKSWLQRKMFSEGIFLIDADDIVHKLFKKYGSFNVWKHMDAHERQSVWDMIYLMSDRSDVLSNTFDPKWKDNDIAFAFGKSKDVMRSEFKIRGDSHDWLENVIDDIRFPKAVHLLKHGEYIGNNQMLLGHVKLNATIRTSDPWAVKRACSLSEGRLNVYKQLLKFRKPLDVREAELEKCFYSVNPDVDKMVEYIDVKSQKNATQFAVATLWVSLSPSERVEAQKWYAEHATYR